MTCMTNSTTCKTRWMTISLTEVRSNMHVRPTGALPLSIKKSDLSFKKMMSFKI